MNSPLKRRNVKLWRFDSFDNQVSLGRGDVVLDEHKNADTIKKHTYLDRHCITLQQPQGKAHFHTGITIVVEEAPEHPAERVAVAEAAATPCASDGQRSSTKDWEHDPSKDPVDHAQEPPGVKSTDSTFSMSLGVIKTNWLRTFFGLDPAKLPGKVRCSTARQALDRHKKVRDAKQKVMRWQDVVPGGLGAPPEIVGLDISQEDLQKAFGFAHTLWFNIHDRWDPERSRGLKGAPTIIAWAKKPDDTVPGTRRPRPLYTMLNELPFGRLGKHVKKDRRGQLCEGGDDDSDDGLGGRGDESDTGGDD